MVRGLFIAGTGTDAGKTYVAALVVRHLVTQGHRVGVYKPIASGCRREGPELVSDDALALWRAAGCAGALDRVCPQRFSAPVAPPVAARAEGRAVDAGLLRAGITYWQARSDIVVVEGVGGLLSPVSDDAYCADMAADFGYPLLIVAPNVLGTINGTLQTLVTIRTHAAGLVVAGVVLSDVCQRSGDPSMVSNRAELESRCHVPVLASVAWNARHFDRPVDWFALAAAPTAA